MTIWLGHPTPQQLNDRARGTMVDHIGIEFTEVGDDYLVARMPVDMRTKQPYGILHGGASAALAETMASVASSLVIDITQKRPVGLEINANHVRAVTGGWVIGTARPLHLGGTTHLWEIRICDEQQKLVCVSRMTMMLLTRNDKG